jgi:hypothetical protein
VKPLDESRTTNHQIISIVLPRFSREGSYNENKGNHRQEILSNNSMATPVTTPSIAAEAACSPMQKHARFEKQRRLGPLLSVDRSGAVSSVFPYQQEPSTNIVSPTT